MNSNFLKVLLLKIDDLSKMWYADNAKFGIVKCFEVRIIENKRKNK